MGASLTSQPSALGFLSSIKQYSNVTTGSKKEELDILLTAHQAGVLAEEEALANEYHDLVEFPPDIHYSYGEFPSLRAILGRQQEIQMELSNNPIKNLVKALRKETQSNDYWDHQYGWWTFGFDKNRISVRTKRGDAYNIAFAQELNTQGVKATVITQEVPGSITELIANLDEFLTNQDKDSYVDDKDSEMTDALEVVAAQTLNRLKIILSTLGNDDEKLFSVEGMYERIFDFLGAKMQNQALEDDPKMAQAWQDAHTLIRWSEARNQREKEN